MDILMFSTVPANSVVILPEEDRLEYLQKTVTLPEKTQNLMFSDDTGAYIRGLVRTYNIAEDKQPSIAFAILEIAIGKKTFDQLPAVFSAELGISPEQAQKMAAEIEKDIFGPVKAELDSFLAPQKTSPNTVVTTAKPKTPPQNVLDLKEIAAAKKQEQITAKPAQQQLPPRPPLRPEAIRGSEGQAGGETTSAPKFPLPPLRPPGFAGQAPKPPVTPINLTGY